LVRVECENRGMGRGKELSSASVEKREYFKEIGFGLQMLSRRCIDWKRRGVRWCGGAKDTAWCCFVHG
jgi:hypothetical protein